MSDLRSGPSNSLAHKKKGLIPCDNQGANPWHVVASIQRHLRLIAYPASHDRSLAGDQSLDANEPMRLIGVAPPNEKPVGMYVPCCLVNASTALKRLL